MFMEVTLLLNSKVWNFKKKGEGVLWVWHMGVQVYFDDVTVCPCSTLLLSVL